jgi:hypothetical protein
VSPLVLSFIGLLVCGAILLLGRYFGAPLLIGLFASLPFGSTAFAALPALGGSSPLIYTLFAIMLTMSVIARPGGIADIGRVFLTYPISWALIILVFYASATAVIMPRLFEGQTTAFVIFRGAIREVALSPTPGNMTQGAYFALDAFMFYMVAAAMLTRKNFHLIRIGLFIYVGLTVALGCVDLLGKLAQQGDVLLPIRTANYALLTEVAEAGFWRIAGGQAEASAFAIMIVSCLAFSFVYWRGTGSRLAMLLAILSFVLAILSTSSTAYVALALLGAFYSLVAVRSVLSGRLTNRDLLVAFCAGILFAIGLTLYLINDRLFDPFVVLFDTMITTKAQSQSGIERAYWNHRSMVALADTIWLGVGLGSSRASSWMVAVASQLGVLGSLLMAILVVSLLRGPGPNRLARFDREAFVLCRATRALASAFLVGSSISGGAANPGVLFFLCLAVVVSLRRSIYTTAGELQQPLATARLVNAGTAIEPRAPPV